MLRQEGGLRLRRRLHDHGEAVRERLHAAAVVEPIAVVLVVELLLERGGRARPEELVVAALLDLVREREEQAIGRVGEEYVVGDGEARVEPLVAPLPEAARAGLVLVRVREAVELDQAVPHREHLAARVDALARALPARERDVHPLEQRVDHPHRGAPVVLDGVVVDVVQIDAPDLEVGAVRVLLLRDAVAVVGDADVLDHGRGGHLGGDARGGVVVEAWIRADAAGAVLRRALVDHVLGIRAVHVAAVEAGGLVALQIDRVVEDAGPGDAGRLHAVAGRAELVVDARRAGVLERADARDAALREPLRRNEAAGGRERGSEAPRAHALESHLTPPSPSEANIGTEAGRRSDASHVKAAI